MLGDGTCTLDITLNPNGGSRPHSDIGDWIERHRTILQLMPKQFATCFCGAQPEDILEKSVTNA